VELVSITQTVSSDPSGEMFRKLLADIRQMTALSQPKLRP